MVKNKPKIKFSSYWPKYSAYIYYFIVLFGFYVQTVNSANEEVNQINEKNVVQRYQVAKFNFHHVGNVYVITLWILLGSLVKIGI